MKIAIDASGAINEPAGIGRYTLEIVRNLIKIDHKNKYLLIFSYFRPSKSKEKLIKSFRAPNVTIKIFRIPGKIKEITWCWKIGSWFEKMLDDADVFFAPSPLEVNLNLKIPQIVTIHDLTPFLFPEHQGKQIAKKLSLKIIEAAKVSKKIIADSNATAQDIQKIIHIKSNKIKVIYPGISKFSQSAKKIPKNLQSKKYILFVGKIEPRKNLGNLFKAYGLLPVNFQKKYPLVVVGPKGWNIDEIFQIVKTLKLEEKIKFLGLVPDEILAKLYQEAAIFVYPSLYEGFGLPVAEALSFGTPTITSNISSLPEVAGKAALLINPQNQKSISQAIRRLIENNHLRILLQKEAQIQVKKFSWEKTARQTLKILTEATNE